MNVMKIAGVVAAGALATGALGAVSGSALKERRNDGLSGRDFAITGIATGVLGAAGLGVGALVAASQQVRGVPMGTGFGALLGAGVAAALTANYLIGWSLTN